MKASLFSHRIWLFGFSVVASASCGGADGNFSGIKSGDVPDASAGNGSVIDASTGAAGNDSSGGSSAGGSSAGGTSGGLTDAGQAGSTTDGSGAGGSSCTSPSTYFADSDGDKFGDPLSPKEACSPPPGFVKNSDDCYDHNADAKPGQVGWFSKDRGDGNFDYDCDKSETQHWLGTGNCGLGICAITEGWQGAVPACGTETDYIAKCGGLAICLAQTTPRTQECH